MDAIQQNRPSHDTAEDAVSAPDIAFPRVPVRGEEGALGFLFSIGHGHYTQFLNFQECFPPQQAHRAEWIAVDGNIPRSLLGRLPFLPLGMRFRANQRASVRAGLARRDKWDALFYGGMQISYLPFLHRWPSYLYTDLTPSLKRELSPWYDHQLRYPAPVQAVRQCMERWTHHACRGIFTMSEWAKRGVCKDYGVPEARVHAVLPGANLRRWPFIDRAGRSGSTRILMVGGQFALKGGMLLLEWAEQTRVRGWELDIVTWPDDLPDWVRACLGSPSPGGAASGTLAPRLPNVRVHCGLRANTPALMELFARADIFCLPTQADGSSIASLEAMASGLPVLVGAVGGIPELIDDGRTGLLLKPGDQNDLTEKLESLLTDAPLRSLMGRVARRSCEERLHVERQVREILAVLDGDSAAVRRFK